MRTLSVSISDLEFSKFGLKKEKMSFSDLLELVSKEVLKKNLTDSVELAEKYGLSTMTMADISKEVKAVRKNAKSHS
jgi:predicted CopG family antitoxin